METIEPGSIEYDENLALEAANLHLKMTQQKVKKLVKQQKLRLVGKLVQQANSDEPWGPAIHVKVHYSDNPDSFSLFMGVDPGSHT